MSTFSGRVGKKTAAKVEIAAEGVYEIVLLLKARCVGGLFFCAEAGLNADGDPTHPFSSPTGLPGATGVVCGR